MKILESICWNGIIFTSIVAITSLIAYYLTLKYIISPKQSQKSKAQTKEDEFEREKYWAKNRNEELANKLSKKVQELNEYERREEKIKEKEKALIEINSEKEVLKGKIEVYEKVINK